MTNRRMFVEGEFQPPESPREAAHRMMARLDEEAAKRGMAVTGDVTILASDESIFGAPRVMRLEADVVTR